MSNFEHPRANADLYRAIIIGAVAMAVIAVSFHGGLDEFAQGEISDTMNESMGIFVVSRAINGGVSVFQTSQINLPLIASVEIGQMLDPVNDAVERLSSILVWAIGSLFVQRILLEVAAGPVFRLGLCWVGIGTTAVLMLMGWYRFRVGVSRICRVSDNTLVRCRDWLVNLFIVSVIVRFVIPVFVAVSFLFSNVFLESVIARNTDQLSVLSAQVSDIAGSPAPDGEQLEEEKADVEERIGTLTESLASARQDMERLDARIGVLNEETGLWRRLLPDRFGGVSDSEELRAAKERRQELDQEVERLEDSVKESEDALKCINARSAGESCDSLLDRISNAGTGGLSQLKESFEKLDHMATSVTLLLVAIAIKNILFPVVFLILAAKWQLTLCPACVQIVLWPGEEFKKIRGVTAHPLFSH